MKKVIDACGQRFLSSIQRPTILNYRPCREASVAALLSLMANVLDSGTVEAEKVNLGFNQCIIV